MIHEDEDEIESEPLAFSWIYYICRAKLHLDKKEAGRITYGQFSNLYRAYQDTFDKELLLRRAGMTYEQLRIEAAKSEEWFND